MASDKDGFSNIYSVINILVSQLSVSGSVLCRLYTCNFPTSDNIIVVVTFTNDAAIFTTNNDGYTRHLEN